MCGRYTLTNVEQIAFRFAVAESGVELEPRYNIAPSQLAPVLIAGHDGAELRMLSWGFRPPRFDLSGPAPINARAETIAEKPLFRPALSRRRCMIPADGFYEWQAVPGRRGKQPYRFTLKDEELFAFAGLYTEVGPTNAGTYTIITTEPNELVSKVHNRMPVILRREFEGLWLDTEVTELEPVLACLTSYPADAMRAAAVSNLVSNVRNEGSVLILPEAGDLPG